MGFSLRQLWMMARAAARCGVSSRPRSSWSFTDAVVVETTRLVLEDAIDHPAPIQRERTAGQSGKPPAGVRVVEERVAGLRARRFVPADSRLSGLVLHLHGGGYVIGGVDEEDDYAGAVAAASGVPVVSLEYRLAPEHVFPAAVEDATAAVRALVDAGQDPAGLMLIGDSAGGGLALAALLSLRDDGGPELAGASLGSPLVDLTCPGATMDTNRASDFLTPRVVGAWARLYANDSDLRDPLASPTFADHAGLPPLQYVVGDSELFYSDVIDCASKSEQAGVDVEVVVGKDACHCWYRGGKPPRPGSRDTITRIADFIVRRCDLR